MGLGVSGAATADPAEEVARIAAARRSRLLRVYRRRLRFEDLEDCYSQATLELVTRARRSPFVNAEHVANALELRFRSRIDDRRRAIEGRSAIEAAIAQAVPVDAPGDGAGDLEDRAAAVERQVFARTEMRVLRELIADLTRDQQLVLASQVLVDMEPARVLRALRLVGREVPEGRAAGAHQASWPDGGVRTGRALPAARARPARVQRRGCGGRRPGAGTRPCGELPGVLADGAVSRAGRRARVGALLPAPAAGGGLLAGVLDGAAPAGRDRAPSARRGRRIRRRRRRGGRRIARERGRAEGRHRRGLAVVARGRHVRGVLAPRRAPGAGPSRAGAAPRGRGATSPAPRAGATALASGGAPGARSVARRAHPRRTVPPLAPAARPVAARHTTSLRRGPRRVSAIAQIRREFGRPHSQVASAGAAPNASAASGSAPAGAAATSTGAAASPGPGRAPPAQTAAQAGQTQAEFGFER